MPLKTHHILGNWLEHATGPQTSLGQDQGYRVSGPLHFITQHPHRVGVGGRVGSLTSEGRRTEKCHGLHIY